MSIFGKPLVMGLDYGIGYGSTALKSLQNDNIPELDLLVREAIQNSSDAAASMPTAHYRVEFNTDEFDKTALCSQLPDVGPLLLKKFGTGAGKFLEIRDLNTQGLTGPYRKKEIGQLDHGNYFKLIFDSGKKQDQIGAGGNWGFGKSVYYRVGEAGLAIFYTRIKTSGGGFEERMVATLIEDEADLKNSLLHKIQSDATGRAWWGRPDATKDDRVLPITDHEKIVEFLDIFGLRPFKKMETGTSVIVPYVDEKRLLGAVVPEGVLKEDERNRFIWSRSIEEYLKYAIQKWYAPKLHNVALEERGTGLKWLRARVNGELIRRDDMQRFFQLTQELYNTALAKCLETKYVSPAFPGIETKEIRVQRKAECLTSQTVGHVAFIKITRADLDPRGLSPYTLTGNFQNSESENEPIVMFSREPGMVINYSISGEWSKGIIAPKKQHGQPDDEYIFAFFVPVTSNAFDKALNPKLAEKYTNLGGYLRECESSDHTDWSDNRGRTLVQKIKYHVGSKVAEATKSVVEPLAASPTSRLSGRVGRLLMPKSNYMEDEPKPPRTPGPGGGGGGAKSKKFAILGTSLERDLLTIDFVLPMGEHAKKTLVLEVQTESGTIGAQKWSEQVGTRFPFTIRSASITVRLRSGEDRTIACNENLPATENDGLTLRMAGNAGGASRIEVVCAAPGQTVTGQIVVSSADRKIELAVKEIKGGQV